MRKSAGVVVAISFGLGALLSDVSALISIPEIFLTAYGGITSLNASFSDAQIIPVGVGVLVLAVFTLGLEIGRGPRLRKRVAAGALVFGVVCVAAIVLAVAQEEKAGEIPLIAEISDNWPVPDLNGKAKSGDAKPGGSKADRQSPSGGDASAEPGPEGSESPGPAEDSTAPPSSCKCPSGKGHYVPSPGGGGGGGGGGSAGGGGNSGVEEDTGPEESWAAEEAREAAEEAREEAEWEAEEEAEDAEFEEGF
jgi:hypothetical protein